MEDVRELNQKRWREQVKSQKEVATAGSLFNRPNPIEHDATDPEVPGKERVTRPYNRARDVFLKPRGEKRAITPGGEYFRPDPAKPDHMAQFDGRSWKRDREVKDSQNRDVRFMPVSGADWTSVKEDSVRKFRIPNTSVVNKVGDIRVPFCCVGTRMTAAQWVWWANFVCFVAHTAMVFVTFHFAYWRWNRSMWTDTEHVTVRIWRISQIPTPHMLKNNQSIWSPGWNASRGIDANEFYLHDNDLAVNFASLVASFFGVSAVFHLWALIVGLFERLCASRWRSLGATVTVVCFCRSWFIYWRQMDDAFCYWRWAEYSISSSLMAMAICISIGLREQSILAGIFMCFRRPRRPLRPRHLQPPLWQVALVDHGHA